MGYFSLLILQLTILTSILTHIYLEYILIVWFQCSIQLWIEVQTLGTPIMRLHHIWSTSRQNISRTLRSLPSQIWLAQEKKLSFSIFVVDACDIQYQCSKWSMWYIDTLYIKHIEEDIFIMTNIIISIQFVNTFFVQL